MGWDDGRLAVGIIEVGAGDEVGEDVAVGDVDVFETEGGHRSRWVFMARVRAAR